MDVRDFLTDLLSRAQSTQSTQLVAKSSIRDFWVWSIITALRSFDGYFLNSNIGSIPDGHFLKYATVCRLRSVVGLSDTINPFNVNPNPLTECDIARRNNLLSKSSDHFITHWLAAVEAVKILYNYDLEKETTVTLTSNEAF